MDARERLACITITSPCTADWRLMKGDDRVRHCGSCRQNVYNFDRMSGAEISELLDTQERVCGRLARRADGTIITNDCSWVWASAKQDARRIVGRSLFIDATVIGASFAVFILTVGLFMFTFFGDNIRILMGASAGGITIAPPPPVAAPSTAPPLHSGPLP